MQRALQNEHEALSSEKEADEMVRRFTTLDMQDESGVSFSCDSDPGRDECDEACTASHCHSERSENGCTFGDGVVEVKEKKEAAHVWKEGLSQAQQTELTLPVLDFDNDMEIQE